MTGLSFHDLRVDASSSCAGKDRFADRPAALYVADRMRKRKDMRVNVYGCGACGGFHIGSQIANLEAKKKTARKVKRMREAR